MFELIHTARQKIRTHWKKQSFKLIFGYHVALLIRPRANNNREVRRPHLLPTRDAVESTRSIGYTWNAYLHRRVSPRSAFRLINSFVLNSYRPYYRIPLTREQRRYRLEWCLERQQKVDKWMQVVFNDESRLCFIHRWRKILWHYFKAARL